MSEHNPYAEEARERWGDTDAYKESQRRTSRYTDDDWVRIKAEAGEIQTGLLQAFQAGTPADSTVATELAEAHRQHISRWFYDCTPEIHRGLGEMYVADPRFTAHYDDRAPGFAAYVRDAVLANAAGR